MLVKRREGQSPETRARARLQSVAAGLASGVMDRRSFLRRSGLVAGGAAALGTISFGSVRAATLQPVDHSKPVERKLNICTHCSVGCSVIGEIQNGVWVGQEPAWDSPINRGTHCAKGASVRELVHGDRRLKYPLKLENGEWKRVSWDVAINEIGDKMNAIRDKSGADSVYMLGSAKFTNEAAYLFRKFSAFWGTNSVDHQARICHSTTVAGVANTWGYGAQTNSYNDIRNAKTIIFMGSNAAEAHPVSLQHILTGKETNRANVFVFDPRFTRTAAHATEYVRFRSGTDIAVIWGLMHHIFANGWEDKDFISKRVAGMDQIRAECAKWTPEETERVTGIPGEQLKKVAETFAKQRPSTFIWCMGGTQHTVRHRQRARVLQPAAGHRQRRRLRHRRQHLPRPHQRAGRNRPWPRYRHAAALLRPRGRRMASLGARVGKSITIICRPASTKCPPRLADRPRPASRAWKRPAFPRPAGSTPVSFNADEIDQRRQRQGDGCLRPWRQYDSAHARYGEGP